MKITVSGGQFFADGFALRGAFCMEEGERRLLSYLSNEGCGCAEATVKNGKLLLNGSVEVIRRKGQAELRPAPCPRLERAFAEASKGDARFFAECVTAPRSLLRVWGDAIGEWKTKAPIFAPSLSVIEGQKQCIVELSAKCAAGEYIAMIALEKGNAQLLLEDYGETVTCRGNEVTVVSRYRDLRARTVNTTYLWQGEGFRPSRTVVCAKDHPFIREVMGRLLVESVIARDEDAMRELLSPEAMDMEAIFDYFGEVTEVMPCSAPGDTAVAVLKREGEELLYVTYDFDFDAAGKIENIRNLEE